jgi:hypothetical protein
LDGLFRRGGLHGGFQHRDTVQNIGNGNRIRLFSDDAAREFGQ